MSAFVTDQFRILNASTFIDEVQKSANSYYVFVGLSNPTTSGFGRDANWNSTPPNPIDNIDYSNHYESTALFGKKITSANIRRVVRKINWVSGQRYEMYRPDYSILSPSPITGAMRLYDANYYVINSDYRVYICVDNGSTGINTTGNASQVEPTFTDLEPSKLSDGYTWKYLYTTSPSDIVKFDTTEYITIPNNWQTSTDSQIVAVRENGDSTLNENQIKKVYVKNGGVGYSLQNGQSCNLVGDGSGGRVSIQIDSTQGKITDAVVTSGGKNYTYALVDLGTTGANTPSTYAELVPIIPPSKGHGFDIYKELGADRILVYARFDDSTKNFPIDAKFAQIGILKNPTVYDSTGINTTVYNENDFSSLYAIKLSSVTPSNAAISVGTRIQQINTNTGKKAVGYVASYDDETKVLKYYKDRSLYFNGGNGSTYQDFVGVSSFFNTSGTSSGSAIDFVSDSNLQVTGDGFVASIDTTFSDNKVTISNRIINLGVQFTDGLAKPQINNKSGEIIYIDNRPTVSRSLRQKEDVKIILEF
ncbi:MAG UNVERIFIED_CONTAM: hypothetical protein LVR29_19890 [Microcystis novacekii LVE1205-3]|jgi:hypothetical protein